MKKIFAVFAAAAAAVSMLAFTGCAKTADEDLTQNPDSVYTPDDERDANQDSADEKEPALVVPPVEDGEIKGNYREVTAFQAATVLSGINANKLKAFSGLGLKTGITASASAGDTVSADAAIVLDYKLGLSSDSAAGAGTATIKADFSNRDYPDKAVSVDLTGTIYNESGFVYASAAGSVNGKVLTGNEAIKVNLQEIMETLSESEEPSAPSSGLDLTSILSIANIIANSSSFGIKIFVDTEDGIKFKLSATEQTVWAAVAAGSEELTESEFERIKESVLFNSFKFDIYFAIDASGTFSRASIVNDIDLTVDLNAIKDLIDPESSEDLPALTLSVKGFSMVYAFDGEVILPDSVTDGYYLDLTGTVLDFLEKYAEEQTEKVA